MKSHGMNTSFLSGNIASDDVDDILCGCDEECPDIPDPPTPTGSDLGFGEDVLDPPDTLPLPDPALQVAPLEDVIAETIVDTEFDVDQQPAGDAQEEPVKTKKKGISRCKYFDSFVSSRPRARHPYISGRHSW